MSSSRSTLLAAVPLAALALPAQDRIEFTAEPWPGCHDPDWIVCLVVDDLTGEPIADADVYLVSESPTPICGEFWFHRKVRTDANGLLRAPVADLDAKVHQLVLRHPERGTASMFLDMKAVWRVGRTFDLPVRILDWRGRPVPGAGVGIAGGCGHSPDLANDISGADGVAVLRGVDPHMEFGDLYVQHPALHFGYNSVHWYPGDGPVDFVCARGVEARGRVVDHLGRPVAGAFVQVPEGHRGPWGRTDADGRFSVKGSDDGVVTTVRLADGREVHFPPPASSPVTMSLPAPEDARQWEGAIDVPRRPRETEKVAVRYVRFAAAEGVNVHSTFPGAYERLAQPDPDTVPVPEQGPFALVAWGKGAGKRRRYFESIDELPAEPIALSPLPAIPVTMRVVDPSGQATGVAAAVRDRWDVRRDDAADAASVAADDGRVTLEVDGASLQLIELRPRREGLVARYLWASLPRAGDGVAVDLGDVELRSAPQLTVVDAGGGPVEGFEVGFARAGLQAVGDTRLGWLDEAGGWHGADLCAGDAIVVKRDKDSVPFRTVLQGDGPWRIEVPDGRLELRVATGELTGHERVMVLVGDHARRLRKGQRQVELRGLRAGPVRLHVSAPGHQTAIVDTVVGAESRAIELTLPAR